MKTPLLVLGLGTILLPALCAEPALTIYNQSFAVVRDSVPLDLKPGINDVQFSGMTAHLEPDSVILRDPAGKTSLQILEQSYRNDPVSQELLLSLFEGKTIDFFIKQPNKPDQTVQGRIVRSGFKRNSAPVIEVDGQLRFGLPGQPIFPSLGDGTVLNPTLSWKLNAEKAAKLDAEIAYVTEGFTWEAAYNLVAPETGDQADLVGWITVVNNSGKTFPDAKIKLMAGDVHKIVQSDKNRASDRREMLYAAPAAPAPVVTEKAFDEFHLYSLGNPTTLRDQETKQVEFVRATGVNAARIYVYDGSKPPGWRVGMSYGEGGYGDSGNTKVNVYREFKNSKENHLGIPLPKGRLRIYRQDEDRQLEFVGEDSIDHTPKDEIVRVRVGDSFDLKGERKQLDYHVSSSNHHADETNQITVKNHKKEPVEIRVVEHMCRWENWEIRKTSQPFEKKDSQTVEFRVPLQPDEEKSIQYRVYYSW